MSKTPKYIPSHVFLNPTTGSSSSPGRSSQGSISTQKLSLRRASLYTEFGARWQSYCLSWVLSLRNLSLCLEASDCVPCPSGAFGFVSTIQKVRYLCCIHRHKLASMYLRKSLSLIHFFTPSPRQTVSKKGNGVIKIDRKRYLLEGGMRRFK